MNFYGIYLYVASMVSNFMSDDTKPEKRTTSPIFASEASKKNTLTHHASFKTAFSIYKKLQTLRCPQYPVQRADGVFQHCQYSHAYSVFTNPLGADHSTHAKA